MVAEVTVEPVELVVVEVLAEMVSITYNTTISMHKMVVSFLVADINLTSKVLQMLLVIVRHVMVVMLIVMAITFYKTVIKNNTGDLVGFAKTVVRYLLHKVELAEVLVVPAVAVELVELAVTEEVTTNLDKMVQVVQAVLTETAVLAVETTVITQVPVEQVVLAEKVVRPQAVVPRVSVPATQFGAALRVARCHSSSVCRS